MNKAWIQSAIYFINVFFHLGIFWVLFTVAVPNEFNIQEQALDMWGYPEGKEIILLNLSFLLANLIFATVITFLANKSLVISVLLIICAWIFLLVLYIYGAEGLLLNYFLGAFLITYISIKKHYANKKT